MRLAVAVHDDAHISRGFPFRTVISNEQSRYVYHGGWAVESFGGI
jgi:hypothetical protein